ncbi:C-type lectin domain family 4 member G-like [Gigantopelta aegis]|uniref:C-type lectin domain family 4 member G-like n=1 Tax=Gigantopelta aegis TaxID=1735272 RepID=UPI001B88CBEA|nr:C-type lectin domain family 4 member G-like [Gigantopelta aegis]
MMQYPSFKLMMRLAVVLCCVNLALSDVRQFIWIENLELSDVAVTDGVISSVNDVATVLDCSKDCRHNPDCWSFTYNTDLTCHLHSVRLAKASPVHSPGSRHYYRVEAKTKSRSTDNCPGEDGYVLLQGVSVCFKVYQTKTRWLRSQALCNKSGSRLIVLDTVEKHTAITEYIKTNMDEMRYWIGLTDKKREGVFLWENGNNVSYAPWKPGSPNNDMLDEDCVILVTHTNWWNDINCNWRYYYICEKLL